MKFIKEENIFKYEKYIINYDEEDNISKDNFFYYLNNNIYKNYIEKLYNKLVEKDIHISFQKNNINIIKDNVNIMNIEIKDNKQNMLRVFLKYDNNNNPVINGIKRVSKPVCRIYASSDNLPRVLNGLGISIITTSRGIISNKKAKNLRGINGFSKPQSTGRQWRKNIYPKWAKVSGVELCV